ncbi:MAG TPA: S4 domain-containing protein [Gammaproteobacteria bacterium]|nr:S4 domain-containing protein [Gammaproteobacteria bacterium]
MTAETARVRIDKWLWAARFFKTRGLASDAVKGGKVHVNGQRVKPAHGLQAGDRVTVTKGPYRFEIDVVDLSEQRGPARMAEQLYRETPRSRSAREEIGARRRAERLSAPRPPRGRPDKKQRRELIRFKQRDG